MQALEKILEEIKDNAKLGNMRWESIRIEKVEEIIRSHMNDDSDDWIPCSERLPEESGHYLVQLSRRIPYENFADRVVMLYDGEEKAFLDYESLIIAWQPLPEPYKPKKK